MASSSKSIGPYDVFLSFRGEVRNNFVSHLYDALVQKGIHTFRDNEELKKGENISMLLKAIKESSIAIIVFSENYASSQWCLEEVTKIMECNKQGVLTVRPVFYKVDPKEVREGRASYARGLAKHESKHSEKMEGWKKALSDAGNLIGWTLNDGDDESKVIQEIVKDILTRLSQTPFVVAEHPVGIESRVAEVKSMFNLESKDGVLMVGLWGQGGIGKTTLGRAIFNDISKSFDGSSFLANVREKSKDGMGLVTLQEQLLNNILLPPTRLVVSDVARGKSLIPLRLRTKRVLVILDDVDDLDQLHALAGKSDWFGSGSRILVTTRDRHLLTPRLDWDHVYVHEVKEMDYSEARELLRKHAFPTYQKLESRTDLLDGFLNHAKGLPLALEVLGSLLCGTTEDVWESILKRLSMAPNEKINNVLKVSYDGLEENEREIFLHVACFFKGRAIEHTERVLDSCDLQTAAGFDTLSKRSLIRIVHGSLQMHDLIQSMGMHMVEQEFDDPGRRSRLWLYEDVLEVLSRDMGDCAAKAIVLELPKPTEICTGPAAFTKMRNLRLLILRNVSFQGPIRLPNQLRWLGWAECSPWIPEFSYGPNKLVVLDIRGGRMEGEPKLFDMPGEPRQFEDFQNLKHISFRVCNSLVCTPDLFGIPNLEELEFELCSNLVEAHESIAYHDKLRVLKIHKCFKLGVFPMLKSKSLQVLSIEDCEKFERFPNIPHILEGLKELNLEGTAIKELPSSIEHLVSLQKMSIRCCMNLESLPSSIYKLQNLEELKIRYCPRLVRFPKYEDLADPHIKAGLSNLRSLDFHQGRLSEVEFLENLSCCPLLRELDLYENDITSLPTSLHKRDHLSLLRVSRCRRLREIPELPPSLNFFQAMDCNLEKSGHLTSFDNFVRRGLTLPAISSLGQKSRRYNILIPGVEMPEWVLPFEGNSISFMASEDLYRKFLGLVLCFVFRGDFHEGDAMLEIEPHVNGKSLRILHRKSFVYLSSDHIYLQYTAPFNLFGEVDFGQIEGSYVQFSLRVKINAIVTKWGFRIICKPLEDDLKIEIPDNQLMDVALLKEVDLESTYSKVEISESTDLEAESSHTHKDYSSEANPQEDLQDCQMSTDEHSQIVPKSNRELSSLEACEPRSRGLLIRLAEMSMALFARCFCCLNDRETC